MDNDFVIKIPLDVDGYWSMQCPRCKGKFKAYSNQFNEAYVTDLFCPLCGLSSNKDHFLPQEVIDHALTLVQNKAMNHLYKSMKKMSRRMRKSLIQIDVKKPKEEELNMLKENDDLHEVIFHCCNVKLKVNFIDAMTILYCPVCGGM